MITTIESQLDTIAQHLPEIKRLLNQAAPDMGYTVPATKSNEEKAHVAQVAFQIALENFRRYPCKPVDKHTDQV